MSTIPTLVIIGCVVAIAFLAYVLIKQDKRIDELQQQITAKKDDIQPYLQLLGSIPSENWNDFMRNPVQVARALGLVVEERALANYNNRLINQLLSAARKARSEEIRYADLGCFPDEAQHHRTLAESYECQARELDQQQRLAR